MPGLDTKLHLNMLKNESDEDLKLYGLQWGDPDVEPHLRKVVKTFIKPYVNPGHNCVEIGPGGGRWTRYLLGFSKIYAVDYHYELLDELKKNFNLPNIEFIKNNGTDFPGIPNQSIDFIFSFGVFVHLDVPLIDEYLGNMKILLKPTSTVFIQYSDKTKKLAQINKDFSMNTPELMRTMVKIHGYTIVTENTKLIPHSSIIVFKQ